MTEQQEKSARRLRTWSRFGSLRRRPTEYEVLTGQFHYDFRWEPAPFEIDPQAPINAWYLRHREQSPFQVSSWEDFRDPHALTYRAYVTLQHQRETYMDGLIDEFEQRDYDETLGQQWVEFLDAAFIPARFPIHVLQMTAMYVGQMSPSAYIANPAHFQGADELRRIQWIAYRTKALSLSHESPENIASSHKARRAWEDGDWWQPLRKAFETMLTAYDWGEAFTALNLVAKPIFDEWFNRALSVLARQNGDELLGLMCDEFALDSDRSRAWSRALVNYAVEREPKHCRLLKDWIAKWRPLVTEGIAPLTELEQRAPSSPAAGETLRAVIDGYDDYLHGCGLA
ncbi:toluene hydroxylase [Mycobacterium sp. SM1]|uniref:toluene hydroxylase n=1 Tax=Mycobacterium sp. SM1 TaxID=2816243 RepID=UPI001BCEC9DC|nr:toluene hydroxylase [Mycobacterium sp. SM1]MBS4730348.1 toluene hydroxylase [Mycobacterium sp. SM1]